MATVLERVITIASERLGVDRDEIGPESRFVEDLAADSLDLTELIMQLEDEFSTPDNAIEVSDDDAKEITTVQNAVDCLKRFGIKDE